MKYIPILSIVFFMLIQPVFNWAQVNYQEVRPYSGGMSAVKIDDRWGYIDTMHRLVINARYDSVTSFHMGLATVYRDHQCFSVDIFGREFIITGNSQSSQEDNLPDYVDYFTGGTAAALKDNKWGVINKNHQVLVPFLYDEVTCWSSQLWKPENPADKILYRVKKEGKYGLINWQNEIILPVIYDYIRDKPVEELLYAFYTLNGKYGYAKITSRKTLPAVFDKIITENSSDTFAACYNGKWGELNFDKDTVIPFDYDSIYLYFDRPYHYRYSYIKRNGSWGLINSDQQLMIPTLYENIYLRDHYVAVQMNGKWGLRDTNDQEVLTCSYDGIYNIYHNRIAVILNGKIGIVDMQGNIIAPFKYSEYLCFACDRILLRLGKKIGALDMNGKKIIPFIYDQFACEQVTYIQPEICNFFVFVKGNWSVDVEIETGWVFNKYNKNRPYLGGW